MSAVLSPDDVIAFWRDAGPARWYRKDEAFDREIAERFGALHRAAANGSHEDWGSTPDGALALILLMDQFSRNMLRDSPEMFAQDGAARDAARRAIAAGFDRRFDPELRQFFYLPFMHSESIGDQEFCVKLSHGLYPLTTLSYARDHERIIRRFGRFPHRNGSLGRHTSPAEQRFLDGGGFAG